MEIDVLNTEEDEKNKDFMRGYDQGLQDALNLTADILEKYGAMGDVISRKIVAALQEKTGATVLKKKD